MPNLTIQAFAGQISNALFSIRVNEFSQLLDAKEKIEGHVLGLPTPQQKLVPVFLIDWVANAAAEAGSCLSY